jgi:phosphopantothenoylcysteine decarboxylase/phosphopantothenate--cysteine ligase
MEKKKGNILIGVCGGIASYKICQLVRLFVKDGYLVKVMMTPAAAEFIRPLVFKELTGQPVYQEMFSLGNQDAQHISLSEWADLAIIAPLSANTLSKVACGICDNLLTSVVCAVGSQKPVLLVPAMNEGMWENPLIQENLFRLKKIKNYTVISPERGELACKSIGIGRMVEPGKIYKKAKAILI